MGSLTDSRMDKTSSSNPMTAVDIHDEGADPLTATERVILELLLKKRDSVAAPFESKPQLESQLAPTSNSAKVQFQIGSPEQRVPIEIKSEEKEEDELNEEELAQLMQEYNLDADDYDDDDDQEFEEKPPKSEIAYAGKGQPKNERSWRTRSSTASLGEDDDFDQDPITRASIALGKLSDDRVIQLMNAYQQESKKAFDYDSFIQWFAQQNPPTNVAATTGGKRAGSRTTTTRGRGRGRGGRGRGRGGRGVGGGSFGFDE